MILNNNKTSILVPYQLPEFIRDNPDYANFVSFLQAYYEWMEQSGNVMDLSKNLLNYRDVDNTTDEFLKYFYNDFLSYFPKELLEDPTKNKSTIVKLAKELYKSKGTPASYQFLFRLLYNADVEFFYTKDAVMKASSGKWYIAKSLRLNTSDTNFLNTDNLRLFGEDTKSIATVEKAILAGTKIEVFISNIERLFNSGEFVRVVDSGNQDVYFLNNEIVSSTTEGAEVLRAKIVGQISQINIDPKNRGQYYFVGDPVVVYNGLTANNARGASATISAATTGSITRIKVDNGGYGYREYPNTVLNIQNAPGAVAHIASVNPANNGIANVSFIPIDYIGSKSATRLDAVNYNFRTKYSFKVSARENYSNGEIVFQGTTKAANTFSGDIVFLDSTNNFIRVANTTGTLANTFSLTGNTSGTRRILNSYTTGGPNNFFLFFSSGEYFTGETIYQGTSYANSTFRATVVNTVNNEIKLSNITGTPNNSSNVIGFSSGIVRVLNSNNTTSNANTSLYDAFDFRTFTTYPIASVIVDNGGGGIALPPIVIADSLYKSEYQELNPTDANTAYDGHLIDYGILAPIQITTGGSGYMSNDSIRIIGGSGYKAFANLAVDGTGRITSVYYVQDPSSVIPAPLGGMGYRQSDLPTISIQTSTGSNGALYVPGILGAGAVLTPIPDGRVGSVTTISISDYGEDYVSQPNVSLRIQDIVVSNVYSIHFPTKGDLVYQSADGTSANATYSALVESASIIQTNSDTALSLYNLRVFNYTSIPRIELPLIVSTKGAYMNMTNSYVPLIPDSRYNQDTGVKTYGDGSAKATAKFLDGLVIGQGQYLDSTGQPSAFDVLQNENYNNFTYQITLEKEIAKYRKFLLDLLHPSGMKVLGRYALKSESDLGVDIVDTLNSSHTLSFYTANPASSASMTGTFSNPSTNIVTFDGLSGANLENILYNDNSLRMRKSDGTPLIFDKVVSVSGSTVRLENNVWLSFANVAYGVGISGNTNINISSLTGSYNLVNGGVYSNTRYPLIDVIQTGDTLLIANNTSKTVSSVNPQQGFITLSSGLSANANGLISISRTISTTGNYIEIFGPVGVQYYSEITDEDGNSIITEEGAYLILG